MPRRASVHIKNLSDGIRHEEIRRVFGKYGHLVDVTVPVNYHSGRSKGFAFVEFEDSRDADDAVYNMNQARVWGREITVELTRGSRKTPAEMRVRDHSSRGGGGSRYEGGSKRSYHARSQSRSRSPPRRSSRRDGGGSSYAAGDEEDFSKSHRRRDVEYSSPRRDDSTGRRHRHRSSRKSISPSADLASPPTKESNGRRVGTNGNLRAQSPTDGGNRYQEISGESRLKSKNNYPRRTIAHQSSDSGDHSPVSIARDYSSPKGSPYSR